MRKNEILGFLKNPLEDLCITRPKERLQWGIDYPGSDKHVVYVWFDALVNYVSGVGYLKEDKKFAALWPADVHVIGKDILRHHAVYWPIMLKAMGVDMPKRILAHGWWTLQGAKMSKSLGNIVDPLELMKKYGVDAFRYFLLNEVAIGNDGAFSEDLLAERYTTDLANDLGNLWFRIATMIQKYTGGKIPSYKYDPDILSADREYVSQKGGEKVDLNPFRVTEDAMNEYDPAKALHGIWQAVVLANQTIEIKKPWVLAKDEAKKQELASVLGNLAEQIAHIGVLLLPFLPETARAILTRLNLRTDWVVKNAKEFEKPFLKTGSVVEKGAALFPRLDEATAKGR